MTTPIGSFTSPFTLSFNFETSLRISDSAETSTTNPQLNFVAMKKIDELKSLKDLGSQLKAEGSQLEQHSKKNIQDTAFSIRISVALINETKRRLNQNPSKEIDDAIKEIDAIVENVTHLYEERLARLAFYKKTFTVISNREKSQEHRPQDTASGSGAGSVSVNTQPSKPKEDLSYLAFLKRTREEAAQELSQIPNAKIGAEIKPNTIPAFSDATLIESLSRNRYSDVLPYNWNRCILHGRANDYINASHCLNNRIIISQGPKTGNDELHHGDFFHMLWEEKCSSIAMVTGYSEGALVDKCSRYLGTYGTPRKVGEYTVTAHYVKNTELEKRGIVISNVTILKEGEENPHVLTHYHILNWADGQGMFPATVALLSQFLLSDLAANKKPLIHCSAGIGRSGTVAAVLSAYLKIANGDRSKTIVSDAVNELRLERRGCVQTVEQYMTIYPALVMLLMNDKRKNQASPVVLEQ